MSFLRYGKNSQNKKKNDGTMNNDKKKVNMNKFVRYAERAKSMGWDYQNSSN